MRARTEPVSSSEISEATGTASQMRGVAGLARYERRPSGKIRRSGTIIQQRQERGSLRDIAATIGAGGLRRELCCMAR